MVEKGLTRLQSTLCAVVSLVGLRKSNVGDQDFRDDGKDAGEIGAGHTVTAFYELIPLGTHAESPVQRPSEFVQPKLITTSQPETMLTVNLRYKQPTAEASSEFQVRMPHDAHTAQATLDFQFASAVVAYGLLLRGSSQVGTLDWDWVIDTAQRNLGEDPAGLRAEFVQLAKTARCISL